MFEKRKKQDLTKLLLELNIVIKTGENGYDIIFNILNVIENNKRIDISPISDLLKLLVNSVLREDGGIKRDYALYHLIAFAGNGYFYKEIAKYFDESGRVDMTLLRYFLSKISSLERFNQGTLRTMISKLQYLNSLVLSVEDRDIVKELLFGYLGKNKQLKDVLLWAISFDPILTPLARKYLITKPKGLFKEIKKLIHEDKGFLTWALGQVGDKSMPDSARFYVCIISMISEHPLYVDKLRDIFIQSPAYFRRVMFALHDNDAFTKQYVISLIANVFRDRFEIVNAEKIEEKESLLAILSMLETYLQDPNTKETAFLLLSNWPDLTLIARLTENDKYKDTCYKYLCSDNKQRIYHALIGINRLMANPILISSFSDKTVLKQLNYLYNNSEDEVIRKLASEVRKVIFPRLQDKAHVNRGFIPRSKTGKVNMKTDKLSFFAPSAQMREYSIRDANEKRQALDVMF
jgi:hypothetical protein